MGEAADPIPDRPEAFSRESLYNSRIVTYYEEVTSSSAERVISELLYLDAMSSDPIWFVLGVPGGGVVEGFGILDAMKGISSPIHTIVLGQCCSMGAVLALCNPAGKRYITRNSSIRLHATVVCNPAGEEDIRKSASAIGMVQTLDAKCTAMMAKATGQSREEVAYWESQGEFLVFGPEAVNYGMADEVIDRLPWCKARKKSRR